ncbi:MAG: DNA repair protein RecO [Clostridia bacterium]|nr:DNA repair protein RecO [Clostridia bacterium]
MQFDVKGLVLRETAVGENDCWLDVLTSESGRMSVYARGVRRYKSRNRDATLPLSYSVFTLQKDKPDFIVMREASRIESFNSMGDLVKNALAMYAAELLCEFALPDQPDPALMRLALNTLYALIHGKYPPAQIKAAFELRLMADQGFAPDLSGCASCGASDTDDIFLDVMNGALVCGPCLKKREETAGADVPREDDGTAAVLVPASRTAVSAMKYIVSVPLERLFSFRIPDGAMAELASLTEKFLLHHLERGFVTLDFYKQVNRL